MYVVGGYELTHVVGSGGFGTVYRGVAHDTGAVVAVKSIDRLDPSIGDVRELIRREASALGRVRSPYCLDVIEVLDSPEMLALVTEYVEGAPLKAVLDHHGALAGPDALHVLWGAAQGLAAVHAAGLVHGDVKPANILVGADGGSKLIDFGLVSLPGWVPVDDVAPWGSPAYASPEQLAHGFRDHRSDLYSLTVSLFELLCGRRPFVGGSLAEVAQLHAAAPVPDPRTFVPELGEDLTRLLLWGLQKDPAARPQDVAAFLEWFERGATQQYGDAWRIAVGAGAGAGAVMAAGALVSGALVSGTTGPAAAVGAVVAAGSAAGSAGAGSAGAGSTAAGTSGAAGVGAAGSGTTATGAASAASTAKAGFLATGLGKAVAGGAAALLVAGGGTAVVVTTTHHHEHKPVAAAVTTHPSDVLVAYTSRPDDTSGSNPRASTTVVAPDGSTTTLAGVVDRAPVWTASPDGRWLVGFNEPGQSEQDKLDLVSTTKPYRAASIDCECSAAFTPNGDLIALDPGARTLTVYGVSASGLTSKRSVAVGAVAHVPMLMHGDPLLATDGRTAVLSYGDEGGPVTSLVGVDLTSGAARVLWSPPDDFSQGYGCGREAAVSADNRYVSCMSAYDDMTNATVVTVDLTAVGKDEAAVTTQPTPVSGSDGSMSVDLGYDGSRLQLGWVQYADPRAAGRYTGYRAAVGGPWTATSGDLTGYPAGDGSTVAVSRSGALTVHDRAVTPLTDRVHFVVPPPITGPAPKASASGAAKDPKAIERFDFANATWRGVGVNPVTMRSRGTAVTLVDGTASVTRSKRGQRYGVTYTTDRRPASPASVCGPATWASDLTGASCDGPVYGDLNGDGVEDAVVPLTTSFLMGNHDGVDWYVWLGDGTGAAQSAEPVLVTSTCFGEGPVGHVEIAEGKVAFGRVYAQDCAGSNPYSTVDTYKLVGGAPVRVGPAMVTASDLERAPVPAMCGFPAGTMQGGQLPGAPSAEGATRAALDWPGSDYPAAEAFGKLDGDDVADAAAVLACRTLGTSGDNFDAVVAFYGAGLRLLGWKDLGAEAIDPNGYPAMSISAGTVTLHTLSYAPTDALCCPSVPHARQYRLSNGTVVKE